MKYTRQSRIRESVGDFGGALCSLDEARRQVSPEHPLRGFYDAALARLCARIDGSAVIRSLEITMVHTGGDAPSDYDFTRQSSGDGLPRPIVALTTIASRLPRLARTIDSLVSQRLPAHSINLFVSHAPYLVDQGIAPDDRHLVSLAEQGVNVFDCANIGPYRKQYPLLSLLQAAGAHPETPFVTVDDDVLYPPDTLERLVAGLYDSDCVTAFRGRALVVDANGIAPYDQFVAPTQAVSLRNLGTGKNGIAYKLGFFPASPEHFVGPLIAPTADDIWCKWVTAAVCIPTRILVPEAAFDPALDFEETDPEDKLGLFHKYNARGSNDVAMQSVELYFANRNTGLRALIGETVR